MQDKRIKKQFSNVVVVEEINEKLVNYHISRLRKHLKLTTNKQFEFYASDEELVQGCKFHFEDIRNDKLFQSMLKEGMEYKAVAIYHKLNDKVNGFIYLLEINE